MTHTAKSLGIGIIGCGNVMEAYVNLAGKLQAEGLAEVVAVCGREHHRSASQPVARRDVLHRKPGAYRIAGCGCRRHSDSDRDHAALATVRRFWPASTCWWKSRWRQRWRRAASSSSWRAARKAILLRAVHVPEPDFSGDWLSPARGDVGTVVSRAGATVGRGRIGRSGITNRAAGRSSTSPRITSRRSPAGSAP